MRYLFSTGLFAALSSGITLLRGSRDMPITWRGVLAWLSWGVSMALAIGAVVDTYRVRRGHDVAADSPLAPARAKRARKAKKSTLKAASR